MSDQWIDHLQEQGAYFADGRVGGFGAPGAENAPLNGGSIICDLSHEGMIRVTGADAGAFLHAQLTNDVLALPAGGAQWNGWCSPKGRLLVTFLAWRDDAGYVLQLPRALQAAIQKRLQMFVLRSKVTLSDEGVRRERFGIAGPSAALAALLEGTSDSMAAMSVATKGDVQVIRLSSGRYEIVAPASRAIELWKLMAATLQKAGAPAWDGLCIREGILQVLPATQDAFVPQMANFELVGGVSFKKGCYPGQEIVARTQYRGILKRRMARVTSSVELKPGDAVYAAEFGDQVAGTVANAAPTAEGDYDALVVAQIDSLKADSLRLGGPDGPALRRQSLPYVIPGLD
jgi:folate-binding protein YgfZ